MKIVQAIGVISLCLTGLSAVAASNYDYESLCYMSKADDDYTKSMCGITQIPQGDHHFTLINFEGEEYSLSDEFTYTNYETYEGEYNYFINGEVADTYLRHKHTFDIIEDPQGELPTLLCYSNTSIEICYD